MTKEKQLKETPPRKSQLDDKQMERDTRKIRIDRVGVKELKYPIQIRDKAHIGQHTIARISMTVDLPHHYKGTHMSRFLEVLNAHGREIHVQNIPDILKAMQKRLDAENAHISFEFPFFLEKAAPVTGIKSLIDYVGRFEASVIKDEMDFITGATIPVTTLCPCSKAISARGAHNQRGHVDVQIRTLHPVWLEDLIAMVEKSASSELYSLLKREDEKAVTERAYDNPVFVEDLVRNVALHLNAHKDITWYKVEAENFESIHNHNAYAMVEKA
ncbi:MAG: GTP cyclohydrolase FolE2 [Verrucomicrobiota bacterium]|nr:GTP cyclohydrolase FolE2 [Verrucomicrobiota bacterium]